MIIKTMDLDRLFDEFGSTGGDTRTAAEMLEAILVQNGIVPAVSESMRRERKPLNIHHEWCAAVNGGECDCRNTEWMNASEQERRHIQAEWLRKADEEEGHNAN